MSKIIIISIMIGCTIVLLWVVVSNAEDCHKQDQYINEVKQDGVQVSTQWGE